jgi:hypothetical protein
MKTKIMISVLAMGGALALAAGCGNSEKSAQPVAANAPAPASDAAMEQQKATEAARKTELDKATEAAKAAEAQLKVEAEKAALAAKAAEAQRQAEADKAATKLAEAEKVAAATVADAKVAAQKLQADAQQAAAAKVEEANTATASLAQQALSAIQQPGQVEKLIASAKNLTGQNKYAEALKIVAELAKLKLSPEQQAMVDQVKQVAEQQMAKALAAKATGAATQALEDALGEKK